MKQLLAGILFLFYFNVNSRTRENPIPWEGTYECFQAYYQSSKSRYTSECAYEIKLIGVQKDSLVTIRNMVTRKMRVLRVIAPLGAKIEGGTKSIGYRVKEEGDQAEGILALNFTDKGKLKSVAIIGSDMAILLTVFYPIYLKT